MTHARMITRLVRQPLYDTEIVSNGWGRMKFFAVPLSQCTQGGEECKNEEHTNLQQSGMLVYPLSFYLKRICFFDENYRTKQINKLIQAAITSSDKETEAALLLERKSMGDCVESDISDLERFSSGSFEFGFSGQTPLFTGPIRSLNRTKSLFKNLLNIVGESSRKRRYTNIPPGEGFSLAFKWGSGLQLRHPRYVSVFLDGFLETQL